MDNTSGITAKAVVLGLGNAGSKIVKELSRLDGSSWLSIGAADTDKASLDNCGLENSFPVGFEWTHGAGCGGDVIKGERAFAHASRERIIEFLTGASLVVVTGGMGGGTATAGCSSIARTAKRMGIPSIFIITAPFSFEGHSKRKKAESGIKMLLPDADIVISVSNDMLYSSIAGETPAEDAFRKSDIEIARAVLGIAEIIRCRNMLSAGISDFKSILQKRKSMCCLGLGAAERSEGENFSHLAIERLIASPLLGGIENLRKADAVILTLTGGPELNIAEMKHALEAVQRLVGEDTELIVGANTDPLYAGRIQLTLISVQYELSPDPTEGSAVSAFTEGPKAEQGKFKLDPVSKGIFKNQSGNMPFLQDFDIPAFLRQGIHIDKGR
jgi:cell division protein FtsZ